MAAERARVAPRAGVQDLAAHLHESYGIAVSGVTELDLGVYRMDRLDGDPWVARVFPRARPVEQVRGDADILRRLADAGYPAERCAAQEAVTVLHGQPLLVTEHVAAVAAEQRRQAVRSAGGFVALGAMLAGLSRLGSDDGGPWREGGGWHHLADGAPREEIAAATRLLADSARLASATARSAYESLGEALAGLDGGDGLPQGLVHPDFVLSNALATADGRLVIVDWANAGRAARMWPLAFMLFTAGSGEDPGRVDRVVAGYRRFVQPEPEELARLAGLMLVRRLILDVWAVCVGRRAAQDVAGSVAVSRRQAQLTAARARAAFAA